MSKSEPAYLERWKSLGTLEYDRRLSAFINRINSGVDRGDDDKSAAYVDKLFADLSASPVDTAALARAEAEARKLEDGE